MHIVVTRVGLEKAGANFLIKTWKIWALSRRQISIQIEKHTVYERGR